MAKFLLIDHSLRDAGGHHYDYAVQVLGAAEQAGLDVYLATHREFAGNESLPRPWPTLPLFAHDTYSRHCQYFANPYTGPADTFWQLARRSWLRTWQAGRRAAMASTRHRHQRQFATACRQLFRSVDLKPGDHVFLSTLSEFDLQGLAECLQGWPGFPDVNWHLQFHFGVFEGRDPEFAAQAERAAKMRTQLSDSLQRLARHRISLYSTTRLSYWV